MSPPAQDMMKRISKSKPLETWNSATIQIKTLELHLEKERNDDAAFVELEQAKATLIEAEGQIAALKGTFAEVCPG